MTLGQGTRNVYQLSQLEGPNQVENLKLLRLTVLEIMHLHENKVFDLDIRVKVTRNVYQLSQLEGPNQVENLKLLWLTVLEIMYLHENKLFDLDLRVKVTLNVAQDHLLPKA